MELKICTYKRCSFKGQPQSVESFYPQYSKPGKLNPWCKTCCNEYSKHWSRLNRDKTKHAGWKSHLSLTYNMTPAEYDNLLKKQNNACAICLVPASELKRKMAVDHDHRSGAVRGLLCDRCNRGLGFFSDSAVVLRAAERYLAEKP